MTPTEFSPDPPKCGTEIKLGLIAMESGTNLSLLDISSKDTACGGHKQKSGQHSGAHYLSLSKPMVNTSCHPGLSTKQSITPKISTTASHCNKNSTTHQPVIFMDMGVLNPCPVCSLYLVPPLSRISPFYLM